MISLAAIWGDRGVNSTPYLETHDLGVVHSNKPYWPAKSEAAILMNASIIFS